MMRIIIAGDICPQDRIASLFDNKEFETVLGGIKSGLSKSDYSIANFECPVLEGEGKPIEKCGPSLKCKSTGIQAIKWAGFDCVTLANNHFLDYGENGVSETLNACKENEIDVVGGGKNLSEASITLFKQINGETLAIINCCEHEYSVATDDTAGSNPLNPVQQFYAIKEARGKADYVLVIVHGGHEHYNLPSPRMVETYRFFVDTGADAVLNHHQHCYSGYEVYNGKPIFYGLGNLCFDKLYATMPESWYEGYMVELSFEKGKSVGYTMIPYSQCKDKLKVELMTAEGYKHFFEKIDRLNTIIADPRMLKKKHVEWMEANGSGFEQQFLPYNNRWLAAAYRRHFLPSFLPKNKILTLLNHIECESHLERTIYALKNF